MALFSWKLPLVVLFCALPYWLIEVTFDEVSHAQNVIVAREWLSADHFIPHNIVS
jgi:hypothetical protein